jgi:hypothetical protein
VPIRVQVGSRTVEFPDGTPQEEMLAALQSIPDDAPKPQADKPTGSMTSALPMIGGMAGSLLGGSKSSPIGMALAGVGGAAGEAFRQVADSVRGDFSNVPETIGGRLKQIGTEGLKQAGMEGAGRVVGGLIQPVAKTLYGLALRPSKALARDAGGGKLLAGTKRIIDQGYADNVLPSGMGVTRAGRKVTESANAATQMAAKSPHTVNTKRVMQRALDDQSKRSAGELTSAGVSPKVDQIATQVGNVIDSNPENLSMAQLLEIRRGAEDVASPVFKAAKLPGGAPVETGSKASIARSISGAAKQSLDDTLGAPFQQINRTTQARSAVKNAVDDAASRPNMLTNLLAGGVGLGSAVESGDPMDAIQKAAIMRAVFSPTLQGATALGIGKAPYAQLFRAAQIAQLQGQE